MKEKNTVRALLSFMERMNEQLTVRSLKVALIE